MPTTNSYPPMLLCAIIITPWLKRISLIFTMRTAQHSILQMTSLGEKNRIKISVIVEVHLSIKMPKIACLKATCLKITKKCLIWGFLFWHFSLIFVLLKLTCLVTLFDRKLQVFQKLAKMTFLAFLMNFVHLYRIIWLLQVWHFSPIYILLKLTCLVTLLDRKFQLFKTFDLSGNTVWPGFQKLLKITKMAKNSQK